MVTLFPDASTCTAVRLALKTATYMSLRMSVDCSTELRTPHARHGLPIKGSTRGSSHDSAILFLIFSYK